MGKRAATPPSGQASKSQKLDFGPWVERIRTDALFLDAFLS